MAWAANEVGICTTSHNKGKPYVHKIASVSTMRRWYDNNNGRLDRVTRFGSGGYPKRGDVVFFKSLSHIAIVRDVYGNYVSTIEGNTNNGRVASRTRKLDILSYAGRNS